MYSFFCISFCFGDLDFFLSFHNFFFHSCAIHIIFIFNYIKLSFSLDCIIFHKKIAQYGGEIKTKCMFCQSSGFCFMFKLNDLCNENQIKIFKTIYNGKIIYIFVLFSSYKYAMSKILCMKK